MKPATILLLLGAAVAVYLYTQKTDNTQGNQGAGGGTPSGSGTATDRQGDNTGNAPGSGGTILADNTSSGSDLAAENYVQDRVSGHY